MLCLAAAVEIMRSNICLTKFNVCPSTLCTGDETLVITDTAHSYVLLLRETARA